MMENSTVLMQVKGHERKVQVYSKIKENTYAARLRAKDGNSIRGKVVMNSRGGKRFYPTNPGSHDNDLRY